MNVSDNPLDHSPIRYRDRPHAGRILALALARFRDQPAALILGIPRGGVVVATEVAEALNVPLDLLPARKIGAPGNPEFAIGAVAGEMTYIDWTLVSHYGIPVSYVHQELDRQRKLSLEQGERLRGGCPSAEVQGKTVIVVDDGVATGATMRAALLALRESEPRLLILAIPVGPADSLTALQAVADQVICPLIPRTFWSVGSFYDDFDQVTDHEVIERLKHQRKGC